MMKKIGIVGCGWLGLRLANKLSERFTIYSTTTTHDRKDSLELKGFNPKVVCFVDEQLPQKLEQWEAVAALDAIVIAVPFSEKTCCVSSLYNRVENLVAFLGDFKGQLFMMSTTSVYPDITKEFTEKDVPLESISGERMIKAQYPQANILRLAGLMGDGRLLCNYAVSNLDFAVNHIHYADIAAIVEKMIIKELHDKIYNVVAPLHPTKEAVIHAQKNLPAPNEFEIKGKMISSSKLVSELDFVFQYPDPRYFHL